MADYTEIQVVVAKDKKQRLREMFLNYEAETKPEEVLLRLEKLCNHGIHKKEKLVEITKEHLDKNEKIVIFTKYEKTARDLNEWLIDAGFEKKLGILSNAIPKSLRSDTTELFNKDDSFQILIMTDALNIGVNLNVANALIHYDYPDSSPVLTQRNKRILSIGSNNPKDIYCLMTEEGIDQKKFLKIKKQEETISQLFS